MGLTGNYLTSELMNELENGIYAISEAMLDKGYSFTGVNTESVDYSYNPANIKSLFNRVETNTQIIDKAADWVNPFSGFYIWSRQNGMILSHVSRWFDWLEYNQQVVQGKQQKQQYLMTTENGETQQLYDVNSEKILTNEGYF